MTRLLRDNGIEPTVVELNIDTVRELRQDGVAAVYGDATQRGHARGGRRRPGRQPDSHVGRHGQQCGSDPDRTGAQSARCGCSARAPIFGTPPLKQAGADVVFTGEGEVALALTEAILRRLGATPEQIDRERERTCLIGVESADVDYCSVSKEAWSARKFLLAFAGLALAQAPQPQKIVITRVFPQPGQIGLFIAAADGSNDAPGHPADIDYDAAWAPDGASIVFTSERNGSADLYRVKPDGTGLERLTDSPAYDDQAAFSPDGKQLVFVSTRAGGTRRSVDVDLQTRTGEGADVGPGRRLPSIVVAGRSVDCVFVRPREQPAVRARPLGASPARRSLHRPSRRVGPEAPDAARRFLRQPEVDGRQPARRRVLHDGASRRSTIAARRRSTRKTRASSRWTSRPARWSICRRAAASSSIRRCWRGDVLPTSAGTATSAGIHYSNGKRGPAGEIRAAAWSPDGDASRLSQAGDVPAEAVGQTWSRHPQSTS